MENYIKKIIYLGPSGSNSQYAAALFLEKTEAKIYTEGVSSITKAIELLDEDDDTTIAILPVENSIEGVVRETLDTLVQTKSDIKICGELTVPICHCLMSKGEKKDIKTIVSHSQAIAQCKNYIVKNFDDGVEVLLYTSTSGAAEYVSSQDKTFAAISSELCSYLYNLNILDTNINDVKDNKTRFIVLSKRDLFKEAKKTRTSIVFTTENKPGALLNVLEVFKKYNLDLIYLESRPSKRVLGEYIFYADIDKGADEMKEALEEIDKKCTYKRILGSYHII